MMSVVILTKNDQDRLKPLISSLSWADEVVVVDDNSDDDTVQIAKTLGATVYLHALNNDFAAQRNYALSKLKSGWVLFIDPDETVSPELIQSIQQVIKNGNRQTGYQIKREDIFYGRKLKGGETAHTWLTRLADANAGRFVGAVHETWQIPQLSRLAGTMEHHSHESISQLFTAVSWYAGLRAKDVYRQGGRWSAWEQLIYPVAKFGYLFLIQRGFLDGWRGVVMAAAMAYHSWLVRWHLWQLSWIKLSPLQRLIRYGITLPFLLLPLGQWLRWQLTPTIAVNGFEPVMGVAILLVMVDTIKHRKLIVPPWMEPVGWFSLWLGITWLISWFNGGSAEAGLYYLRWLLYAGFLLALVQSRRYWLISAQGLLMYIGSGLLTGGWLQYLISPDMRWLYQYGWDDHYYRMIGLLYDPNFLSLMMVLSLIVILTVYKGWWRWMMAAVTGGAILASFSRLGYGLGGLVMTVFGWKERWRWYGMLPVVLLLIFLLLPKPGGEGVNLGRWFSVTSRVDSIRQAIPLIRANPVVGIGFNQYATVMTQLQPIRPYHAHGPDNSYILVLVTSGVIGLGLWIWMWRSWWCSGSSWVQLSLAVLLLHGLGNNSLFYPWVLLWIWLLLNEKSSL